MVPGFSLLQVTEQYWVIQCSAYSLVLSDSIWSCSIQCLNLFTFNPRVLHQCGFYTCFPWCGPMCAHRATSENPEDAGCPSTLIPFRSSFSQDTVFTARQPSPSCDRGLWIYRPSVPPLLWTPPLGLSTYCPILDSLVLTKISSSPLLFLCLLLQALVPT